MNIIKKFIVIIMNILKKILKPFKMVSNMIQKIFKCKKTLCMASVCIIIALVIFFIYRRSTEGFRTTFSQAAPLNPINNKKSNAKF